MMEQLYEVQTECGICGEKSVAKLPLGHGDCKKHCLICMPELRKQPLWGVCPKCFSGAQDITRERGMN